MKKILIISRYDSKGSGSVAYNVRQGLKAAGHDVRLLVEYTEEKDPDVISLNRPAYRRLRDLISSVIKRVKHTNPLKTDFNYKYAPYSLHEHIGWYRSASLIKRLPFKPDVIIYLFLNGYVNSRNIHKLYQLTKARILFYPMDMALMTGGCHYAWECTHYTGECGQCPALRSRDPADMTFRNLKFKERYLSQLDFTVLASGSQIAGQLAQSRLFRGRKIVTCVEPIDSEIFKPGDSLAAKKHFGIDPAKKVIFFGAHNVHDLRKGFTYLLQALDLLYQRMGHAARDNVCVLVAGNDDPSLPAAMPFPCLSAGFLDINRTLPLAFHAADVFACTSVQDSGPMMINQSILCGTPVVAFQQGAALELVATGETGYQARLGDPDDFAHGLSQVLGLDAASHARMRQSCRAKGMAECSIPRAAAVIDALVSGN